MGSLKNWPPWMLIASTAFISWMAEPTVSATSRMRVEGRMSHYLRGPQGTAAPQPMQVRCVEPQALCRWHARDCNAQVDVLHNITSCPSQG
jgi:hypothetical protein